AHHCEQALQFDRGNAYAHYILGAARSSLGEYERALDSYTLAEPIGGGWPANRRGWTLLKLDRYGDAAEEFGQAFKRNPGDASFLAHKGLALALAGRPAEARAVLDEAVSRYVGKGAGAYCKGALFRACFEAAQGRQSVALADFINVAEQPLGDVSAATYLWRAMARQRVGRLREALDDVDRPLRMQPGRPDFHYRRGRILLDLGNPDQALKAFERGLELKPGAEEHEWGRRLALRDLGRAPDEDVRAPVPEHEEWLYALSRLAAIG
ncbi:MAG: tetratricopeptide repeat protein, partial [Planctomycetota bacterium]